MQSENSQIKIEYVGDIIDYTKSFKITQVERSQFRIKVDDAPTTQEPTTLVEPKPDFMYMKLSNFDNIDQFIGNKSVLITKNEERSNRDHDQDTTYASISDLPII